MAATNLRSRPTRSKPKQQPTRARATRKPVSYCEDSSTDDQYDGESSQDEHDAAEYTASSMRTSPHQILSKPATSSNTTARKRKASRCLISRPGRSVKTEHGDVRVDETKENSGDVRSIAIQESGKQMPWHTLPYSILATIFDHASRPLVSEIYQPLPSINWLLQTALICKAFTEPALSALYYSPPLTSAARAHALYAHLFTQTHASTLNYSAKIKYLEIEAVDILMHKYAGQDPLDLGSLVALTPQLRGIGIHLLSDNPRYRKATSSRSVSGKPVYSESLFQALEYSGIKLREWTWNLSLAKASWALSKFEDVYTKTTFQNLRRLSIINYDPAPGETGKRREEMLSHAFNTLPNLTEISFASCPILDITVLRMLPNNLQSLSVTSCASLKSSGLSAFLDEKGQNLRQLVLDHNPHLNLSFLNSLAHDCPKLELLKMDLLYYNGLSTVTDTSGKYRCLFEPTDVPLWSASLQTLELYHLRKWDLPVAQIFFASLVESAEFLSNLRQLRIKAYLDRVAWKERIKFRDEWTMRLQHVFRRRSPPPNPHLRTIAAYKAFKQSQKVGQAHARLSRVEVPATKPSEDESDSDVPLIKTRTIRLKTEDDNNETTSTNLRRSTRATALKAGVYDSPSDTSPANSNPAPRRRKRRRRNPDDSSSEDSALDDDALDRVAQTRITREEAAPPPPFIQGLCDVVEITITNLRPTEEQLDENDFLDDEASGDEDWNGDDDMEGEDRYAW